MTVYNSGLPGIDGESGHVTEYDASLQRYRVLLNSGHVYYFASHLLELTKAPTEAAQLPPMQKHPLPARVTPGYKPPPVSVSRPEPAADQIEPGPPHPVPYPVRSALGDPPPPPPGPVPTEPSAKQGPPPKTQRPRIPQGEQPILGFPKGSPPLAPPAKQVTLHYSMDPRNPGPIAKPAAGDPGIPSSSDRPPSDPAPPEPTQPKVVIKPGFYTDYRKGAPLAGKAISQPTIRRWIPKLSDRPPAPPVPKTSTAEAAPTPGPTADPARPDPALPNEAGREPTSAGGTQATETGEPKGGSRRVGVNSGILSGSPLILSGEQTSDSPRFSIPTWPFCESWTSGTRADT